MDSLSNHKPRADTLHPVLLPDGRVWPGVVYLKNVIHHPKIEIGDFSYYNDFRTIEDYARQLAPYLFPESPERLVIGKFVQIAHGAQFITSSANHQMNGFSAYPFATFGGAWAASYEPTFPQKGDTVIGHDVWLGHEAVIMPGVHVGPGAIIGTRAVVTKNVLPYSIVAGNPAKLIRTRFDADTITELLHIAWWDWPIELIEENIKYIVGNDLAKLRGVK